MKDHSGFPGILHKGCIVDRVGHFCWRRDEAEGRLTYKLELVDEVVPGFKLEMRTKDESCSGIFETMVSNLKQQSDLIGGKPVMRPGFKIEGRLSG